MNPLSQLEASRAIVSVQWIFNEMIDFIAKMFHISMGPKFWICFFRRSKFSFHERVCKLLQNIDEDDFVDVIVECADNKIVKGHRVIMAMHSRIFQQQEFFDMLNCCSKAETK